MPHIAPLLFWLITNCVFDDPQVPEFQADLISSGKVPKNLGGTPKRHFQLNRLRSALQRAIDAENYEDASSIRDKIKAVENGSLELDDQEMELMELEEAFQSLPEDISEIDDHDDHDEDSDDQEEMDDQDIDEDMDEDIDEDQDIFGDDDDFEDPDKK